MGLFKSDIDHLDQRLGENIRTAAQEFQASLDQNIRTASRELGANIERIADRMDAALAGAETGLRAAVKDASDALDRNISRLGDEVSRQRSLTRDDITSLVDYACEKFDTTMARRLAEATGTLSGLVDQKIAAARAQLAESAREQKRTALRNMLVALGGTILTALIVVAARRHAGASFDALTIFRITYGALTAGGVALYLYRAWTRYRALNPDQRNLAIVLAGDARMFSPEGVLPRLLLLLLGCLLWFILAFRPEWLGLHAGRLI
ncbi:MAG: hypothetical protein LBG65_00640 [Puniceicoccales bacterium]|nr:hypothetical protein [Puniceicoccales bacterium]